MPGIEIVSYILIFLGVIGVTTLVYIKTRSQPDIWLYDAAQYIATRDWRASQIVGYGEEIGRLKNDGTIFWQ